jgi:predicted nucleic acid-binding protein
VTGLRLFIDSGPFVGLYYADDEHHGVAADSFGKIARHEAGYRKLYTSDYILDEAVTACRRRTKNHTLAVRLGTDILSSKSIIMLRVDQKTLEESWRLYKERDDVNLSFTDATCVILARTHGISDIFTFNTREFRPLNLNVKTSL